jgi:pyruvate/2-oxoglutarate dehydrogenase complex dihydrolipoamide acyltransferase (E2) component
MKRQIDQVIPYSKSRRFMKEAIRSTHHKPLMHGLIEVDVTKARAYIRDAQMRTGETPSFTAFIIACLGRAVEENKHVHALWKGGRHLVLFRDVDVLTWIERELGGEPQVLPCIVRSANRRTFQEIHTEIRAAQVEDPRRIDVGGAKAAQLLPAWAYRPYFALITRLGKWVPLEWKKRWGTITLTAVGMIGEGSGWGIPPSSPSICWITVGGIRESKEEFEGRTRTRDYLNLTVSFDHNMIDAAPAARFTERLRGLIESGYSLPLDQEAEAQPVAT